MSETPIIVELNAPAALPDGRVRLSCAVRVDDAMPREVWFHVPADAAPENDDWAAPLMVVRAMELSRPLRIAGRITARMMENIGNIQGYFARGEERCKRIDVTADTVLADQRQVERPVRAAAFFSGGLDSWYTVLRNLEAIESMVFAVGIDMSPTDVARRASVQPVLERAAAQVGKPLTVFETNVRDFFRGLPVWARLYLGPVLASCALALSGRYNRVYLGAGHNDRAQHIFWSFSATAQAMWYTDATQALYDGPATRVAKCMLIAESPAARTTLRVCWRKESLAYNCGRCDKCVRTMAALRLLGALERCPTFEPAPDLLERVAALPYDGWGGRTYLVELLELAIQTPNAEDMIRALCTAMARGPAITKKNETPRLSLPAKMRRETARALRQLAARVDRVRPH